jgi:hypothetical protein
MRPPGQPPARSAERERDQLRHRHDGDRLGRRQGDPLDGDPLGRREADPLDRDPLGRRQGDALDRDPLDRDRRQGDGDRLGRREGDPLDRGTSDLIGGLIAGERDDLTKEAV